MKKNNKSLKIHWNSSKGSQDFISVLEYLKLNEIEIRDTFFEMIDSYSKTQLEGKSLFEYYKIDEYNFWFMSTIYEKSFFKSPYISDVIKYLTVQKIIKDLIPESLVLINANKSLNEIIKNDCYNKGINFLAEKELHNQEKKRLNKIFFIVRGILYYFRFVLINFNSHHKKQSFFSNKDTIFLCSYLTHIDKYKISKDIFSSAFWGELPVKLNKKNKNLNWLHLSVKNQNADIEFRGLGVQRKNMLNRHNFLSSFLSLKSWLKIINNYITIVKRINRVNAKILFKDKKSISSLFLKDFLDSSYGPILIQNLIYVEGFETLFKDTPKQEFGLYLQENQGWEIAFVNAWKKHKHGKLIAIQHSTVSFWDMRYENPYYKLHVSKFSPDLFAVNGQSAKNHFKSFKYPSEKVVESEALRYLNLGLSTKKNKKKGILLLGDTIEKATQEMLNTFLPISNEFNRKITFKPHPAKFIDIDKNQYPNVKITDLPLTFLLKEFDIVICCSSSGAAVEAFIKNIKTIIFIIAGDLNTSPLKDHSNVFFVSTQNDIRQAINSGFKDNSTNDFFYLDNNMPKWKKILNT